MQNNNPNKGKLPEGYLEDGYFTAGDKPVLRPKYIIEYPQQIAQGLGGGYNIDKSTQLRKFYDFCISLRDQMYRKGCEFEEIRADFSRLLYFAEYAKKRKRVSELFQKFIEKNVRVVCTQDDFLAFLKHFEAVIAYLPKD